MTVSTAFPSFQAMIFLTRTQIRARNTDRPGASPLRGYACHSDRYQRTGHRRRAPQGEDFQAFASMVVLNHERCPMRFSSYDYWQRSREMLPLSQALYSTIAILETQTSSFTQSRGFSTSAADTKEQPPSGSSVCPSDSFYSFTASHRGRRLHEIAAYRLRPAAAPGPYLAVTAHHP